MVKSHKVFFYFFSKIRRI